jgi:membrane-bound inhibitor of C-type lysozyme
MKSRIMMGTFLLVPSATGAKASDVTIHLRGSSQPIVQTEFLFDCGQAGSKMGLQPGTFKVTYINGAGNSLAVIPVNGSSLIFVNVASGSGARYAAGQYVWWDADGRSVTFSADSSAGRSKATCRKQR